jgi:hypothetical protein
LVARCLPVEGVPELVDSFCPWPPENLEPELGEPVQRVYVSVIDALHGLLHSLADLGPGIYTTISAGPIERPICILLALLVHGFTLRVVYRTTDHCYTVDLARPLDSDELFMGIGSRLRDAFLFWRPDHSGPEHRKRAGCMKLSRTHTTKTPVGIVQWVIMASGHSDLISVTYWDHKATGILEFQRSDVDKIQRLYPGPLRYLLIH